MKSDEVVPAFETSDIGTPGDYTEDLYRFYLEFRDVPGTAERVIKKFLKDMNLAVLSWTHDMR